MPLYLVRYYSSGGYYYIDRSKDYSGLFMYGTDSDKGSYGRYNKMNFLTPYLTSNYYLHYSAHTIGTGENIGYSGQNNYIYTVNQRGEGTFPLFKIHFAIMNDTYSKDSFNMFGFWKSIYNVYKENMGSATNTSDAAFKYIGTRSRSGILIYDKGTSLYNSSFYPYHLNKFYSNGASTSQHPHSVYTSLEVIYDETLNRLLLNISIPYNTVDSTTDLDLFDEILYTSAAVYKEGFFIPRLVEYIFK